MIHENQKKNDVQVQYCGGQQVQYCNWNYVLKIDIQDIFMCMIVSVHWPRIVNSPWDMIHENCPPKNYLTIGIWGILNFIKQNNS